MLNFLGPILGAATGIFGNILGKNAADDAAEQQQANFFSNQQMQREFWEKNYAMQKEFAQSGIRWRVEDAKAAGVHPLFALGGGGAAASPTAYVGGDTSVSHSGDYLAKMGQDLGRAISATSTAAERSENKIGQLAIERGELENALLRSKLAKENAQIGPPMPGAQMSPGPEHGFFEYKPAEVAPHHPQAPSIEAGPLQPYTQFRDGGDKIVAMPHSSLKVEDEFGAPLMAEWWANNKIMPSDTLKPPENVWRKKWPDADGVEWSIRKWGWVPYKLKGTAIRQEDPIGDTPIDWAQYGRWLHGKDHNPPSRYYGSEGF